MNIHPDVRRSRWHRIQPRVVLEEFEPHHNVRERIFPEDDSELAQHGGLQVTINENDGQNRTSPHGSRTHLVRRSYSPTESESSIEYVPRQQIHRRHSHSSPRTHLHQNQNVTIRPGGPGGLSGSWAEYGYLPPDPNGRYHDHWELSEQHIRDKVIAEQREEEHTHEIIRRQAIADADKRARDIDERMQKAVADYKEDHRRVDDEIRAAIDRHDLEAVRRKQENKAAIEAALKKKMEEDEERRREEDALRDKLKSEEAERKLKEAATKAKLELDQARKQEEKRAQKKQIEAEIAANLVKAGGGVCQIDAALGKTPCCGPNTVSGCFPRFPVGYIASETLNHFQIPWQYDRDDQNYIVVERELPPRDLEVLVKHTRGLFHCDTKVVVGDDDYHRGRGEYYTYYPPRRSRSAGGYRELVVDINGHHRRKPKYYSVRRYGSRYGDSG